MSHLIIGILSNIIPIKQTIKKYRTDTHNTELHEYPLCVILTKYSN